MYHTFPYENIVVGTLVIIVGFVFHWIGQLVSVLNWNYATKIGLQEANLPKEYKVYECAIAKADVFIGWIHGLAGIGLLFNYSWGYKLSWFPGAILLYHSISYWFWTMNRNKDGNNLESKSMRIVWTLINFVTGVLTIGIAWNAS